MILETALFITATLGITTGCLLPAGWLPALPNDKLLHFLAFGGLALLAWRLAHTDGQRVIAMLLVFAIGLVIEVLQNAVPGRKFCWRDLLANTAGIASAVCCSKVLAIL